jgi:hypothetical protein
MPWPRRPNLTLRAKVRSRLRFPNKEIINPAKAMRASEGAAAHLSLCYFFLGTLLPFLRALERAIAIACFRLFTFAPFPPFSTLVSMYLTFDFRARTSRIFALPFLRHSPLL